MQQSGFRFYAFPSNDQEFAKAPSSIDDRVLSLSTIIGTSQLPILLNDRAGSIFESFHIDQAVVRQPERFAGQLYLGRKQGKAGLIHDLLIVLPFLEKIPGFVYIDSRHSSFSLYPGSGLYRAARPMQKSRQKSR
jgi:hypothetical protein